MFTIGQGLYNLTERDRTTLFVDPFYRQFVVSAGAASLVGAADLNLPLDRALYINSIVFNGAPTALSRWTNFELNALANSGSTGFLLAKYLGAPLIGDNSLATAVGDGCVINRDLNLVIPPNTNALRFSVTRDVVGNAASCTINLSGFLIPPGGIGRIT